jgi:multidrug efflux pump subunit AcrB
MSRFAIRYPYLMFVLRLAIGVVGTSSILRMPADLFPPINIPVLL